MIAKEIIKVIQNPYDVLNVNYEEPIINGFNVISKKNFKYAVWLRFNSKIQNMNFPYKTSENFITVAVTLLERKPNNRNVVYERRDSILLNYKTHYDQKTDILVYHKGGIFKKNIKTPYVRDYIPYHILVYVDEKVFLKLLDKKITEKTIWFLYDV